MSHDVFISYARASAGDAAAALRDLLAARGRSVFLDAREIPWGDPFPQDLARGLTGARVAVVFTDPSYLERPWCAFELGVLVAPYRGGLSPGGLEHVVVALPDAGADAAAVLDHLPPPLAARSWPKRTDAEALASLVEARLAEVDRDIGARLEGVLDEALARLLAGGQVPSPKRPGASSAAPTAGAGARAGGVPESRGDGFVGRERDLWRVFEALVTQRALGSPRWVALEGPAGSGKSQLAAEIAWRYAERWFPGGIVWIDAEADDDALAARFREVLASFAPGVADPSAGAASARERLSALAGALRAAFGRGPGRGRTLWIVDGVPEDGSAPPGRELDRLCPPRADVDVLCTSRRTGVGPVDARVALGWLEPAPALALLTRPPVDPGWLPGDGWAEVVRWAGGSPLALQVLRASAADGYATARALLAATRDEPAAALDGIMASLRGEVDERQVRGVAEAYAFSYRSLEAAPDALRAAHLLARLPPLPVREGALAALLPAPALGRLARRSWIEPRSGAERRWAMHGVTASFLRGRSGDPDGELAALVGWIGRLAAAAPDARAPDLDLLAPGVVRAVEAAHRAAPDGIPRTVEAARALALGLVPGAADDASRGVRFLAARLAAGLGFADEVAARLEAAYATGDERAACAIPHTLTALGASPRAAALMGRLLDDARDGPRWQALVHAAALAGTDARLGEKVLDALLRERSDEVRRHAVAGFDAFLDAGTLGLPSILSAIADALAAPAPEHRRVAAELLERVLIVHGAALEAGGFRSPHLLGALTQRALYDPDPAVAIACVQGAGTYFDPTVHAAIARALREGEDPRTRHRAAMVLVEYLEALARPPPVRARAVERDDGVELQLDLGDRRPTVPSAAYEPLVEVIELPDDDLARHAAERLFGDRVAAEAWMDVCDRWLAEKRLGRLERLADRVIALAPEQPTGYWRRAQVREAVGDVEGAIADHGKVVELTPRFVEARERRAILRVERGEFEAALDDLSALAADDPGSFTAHHVASLCLYNLGRHAEAEAEASRAIGLHPEIGEAWFFRAVARYAADRPGEALVDVRKAVDLAPDDERAVQFLGQLEAWLARRGSSADASGR